MAGYSCKPCGDLGAPGCADGMKAPQCKDEKAAKYNPESHLCEALVGPGGWGQACGTDPANQCQFKLKCLPADASKPDGDKACLCDPTAPWTQCGDASVCAPGAAPPPPPSPTGKFAGACNDDQRKAGNCPATAPFYCFDGAGGCNKDQSFFEGRPDCNHFCKF